MQMLMKPVLLRGVIPRAAELLGPRSPSLGPRGKPAFLPEAEKKVCYTSQEEVLMG